MKNKIFYKSNAKSASKLGLGIALALAGVAQQAQAHVEYYDLNQGAQIGDLTAAGKVLSTAQYGGTPAAVLALGGAGLTPAQRSANGIGSALSGQSDRPLNDPSQWNAANQAYTGVGSFTNVNYSSAASSATVDVDDVTSYGWYNGTTALLGDSHKVDFFNFRLDQESKVTISWTVDDGTGNYIDSAFTLYNGVLNYQAHDDANEKLNPKTGLANSTKVQDALDSANAPVDAQGIASSFRDTSFATMGATNYVGQFNALANWGQANVSGDWGNIEFRQAVNDNNPAGGAGTSASETIETLTLILGAGNYTIGASGAVNPGDFSLSNLHGHLEFSAVATAAAVPVPGAVWLFGTVLAGFVGLNRRKVLFA
ncbi:PEP-CTERM sorting domain-containing protein [Methylomonas sp. MED-D]|uniref:PEP-CTERM sorting domain-containing protein n=1 Tax=unclassified Methylomonas TaxID=2608980 RepID=UPI0028A549D6|nr:PEP-CTERM sorting domain-containing protein [Methylomonas sp. MV1]MDT4331050.1 PEP-CTERM sorting domain-containing protein [Methylomonas sp. MV1]